MFCTHSHARRLAFQQLEDRSLMAGDVHVAVTRAGDLLVTGDDAGNGVEISYVSGNTYRVAGTTGSSLPGLTTIDGQPYRLVSGVTRDVKVDMGQGVDMVLITNRHAGIYNTPIPRDLEIKADGSLAIVSLQRVSVGDDMLVDMEAEKAVVSMQDVKVGRPGNTALDGGDNNLDVRLEGIYNHVFARKLYVRNEVTIDVEGPRDSTTGIDLNNLSGLQKLNIDTSEGESKDYVYLRDVETPEVEIRLGEGNDKVELDALAVDVFFAELGDGDDEIVIDFSEFSERADFRGGAGNDAFHLVEHNVFEDGYDLSSFEN